MKKSSKNKGDIHLHDDVNRTQCDTIVHHQYVSYLMGTTYPIYAIYTNSVVISFKTTRNTQSESE